MQTGEIIVNLRSMTDNIAGTQRYSYELIKRLGSSLESVAPLNPLHGIRGHLWEQFVLPQRIGKKLLWSPANTGPLAIRNQVVTIFDLSALEHPEWFSTNFTKLYKFLLPNLTKKAQKVLTISEFSKERIVEICGINPEKIVVTYLSADQNFSPKTTNEITKAHKEVGIPTNKYLLALGSLEPRKNLNRLLRAWEKIYHQLSNDVWLVLAGAKGKETIFKSISLDNLPPRVYLSGYVPDNLLPALLSGAITFLYPSLYEGFGLPPLEAMACGTPVMTSNITSLPEVTGDAALLVNPYDTEAIADGIKQLLENTTLREQLKSKGYERIKNFSWEKTADQTWQVLQEAAGSI